MLYGRVKELARDGLVDSFWISNGTFKMKELSESQPVSITHLIDLEDWHISILNQTFFSNKGWHTLFVDFKFP